MRGEHGWGSSWGLLNAGFVFTLFLCAVAGARKKMTFSWVSLTALSFMLTTPSWGTLLNQITGVMDSIDGVYEGMTNTLTYINPLSGVAMMLFMGFGLSAFFGIFLGKGFSDKQWKWWNVIVVIGVSVAVYYIVMATIAHPIIKLIQPESVKSFENGLVTAGKDFDSVHKIYLKHFDDLSWAKKIGGGRNYFSEVQAVAATFRAITAILTTLIVVKDKVAAKVGALSCTIFAVAITLADVFFYVSDGGYRRAGGLSFNSELLGGAWSWWEFTTGFLAGGALTLVVLSLKKKDDVPETVFSFLPDKAKTVLGFIVSFIFATGVNIVRPLLERLEDAPVAVLVGGIAVALVAYILFMIFYLKKNGISLQKTSMNKFAPLMVTIMTLFDLITYMFVATQDYRNYNAHNVLTVVLFVSAISVAVFNIITIKKAE